MWTDEMGLSTPGVLSLYQLKYVAIIIGVPVGYD
jgi:hypothetical protein